VKLPIAQIFAELGATRGVGAVGDFDGQMIDVIAEGLPIDRGQTVVVVKARGNRVVVRNADA
jgi:membrane-bound ClpP family serine protease